MLMDEDEDEGISVEMTVVGVGNDGGPSNGGNSWESTTPHCLFLC